MDAYWLGIKKAKFDNIIIPFTPDGNMMPKHLPELVKTIKKGYKMVIVSRYKDNARSYDDTWITGFGNFMTFIQKLFLNLISISSLRVSPPKTPTVRSAAGSKEFS